MPQWLDHLLQDYAWWRSSHHHSGTILCVKKNIAITTQASQVQCQDSIDGRILAATLKTSTKPIFSNHYLLAVRRLTCSP
eukprot:627185-Pelagomonas_calceolata.AAC.1